MSTHMPCYMPRYMPRGLFTVGLRDLGTELLTQDGDNNEEKEEDDDETTEELQDQVCSKKVPDTVQRWLNVGKGDILNLMFLEGNVCY